MFRLINCMKSVIYSLVCVLLFSVAGFSQSQQELYKQSVQAYNDKNFSRFLVFSQKLDSIRPSHPTFTYNLAVAYALNNQKEAAVSTLEKAVLMNNEVAFETDADFLDLQNSAGFKQLLQLKTDLGKSVTGSRKVVSLSEKELHPEGLLYLPQSKTWLASSIRKRKIVSFDVKTGQCQDWLTDKGLLAVFAMKADEKEKYLWVSSAAMPEMEGYTKDQEGRAEVLKIDIKTRKIVNRFMLAGNHVFGDLVIAKDETVYVSDSGEAIIYKIANDKMEVWLDLKKEALNLQGLAFNDDQSKLFIADYLKGILVIPMKNPSNHNWLPFPKGTTVKGIDGLVYYKNTLIAVHNGVKPIRLVQYNLNGTQEQIIGYTILDYNRPEFDEPALATVANGKLYFFSNSPWKAYDKNFTLDATQFENPMLFELELK